MEHQSPHDAKAVKSGFRAFLARRLLLVAGIVLASTALVAWKIVTDPPLGRSEVVVFVGGTSTLFRLENGAVFEDPGAALRKVQYLASSSEMFDHLIDRFGLAREMPDVQPSSGPKDALHLRLADRVQVTLLDRNAMRVVVRDEDAERAAAMANELFAQLQVMMERDRRERLQRALQVHEQAAMKAREHMEGQLMGLEELVQDLREVKPGLNSWEPWWRELDAALQELIASGNGQLRRVEQQAAASVLMDVDLSTDLQLVRKAIPEAGDPLVSALRLWLPVTLVISLLLTLSLLGLWWIHGQALRSEWHAFLNGDW